MKSYKANCYFDKMSKETFPLIKVTLTLLFSVMLGGVCKQFKI